MRVVAFFGLAQPLYSQILLAIYEFKFSEIFCKPVVDQLIQPLKFPEAFSEVDDGGLEVQFFPDCERLDFSMIPIAAPVTGKLS